MNERVREAILVAIPDATVEVKSQGGHFQICVISSVFEGKNLLEKQRIVYAAIAPFMNGSNAPVHAVDTLKTLTPQQH